MLRLAGQILGSDLLERVAQFLMDLRTTYDGVARRSKEIEAHFQRASTLVVTTSDPAPLAEATRFFLELPEVASAPTAVVFNRTLPAEWASSISPVPPQTNLALAENLARWGAEAQRQNDSRLEFAARYDAPLVTVPWMKEAPNDVVELAEMIERSAGMPELWSTAR